MNYAGLLPQNLESVLTREIARTATRWGTLLESGALTAAAAAPQPSQSLTISSEIVGITGTIVDPGHPDTRHFYGETEPSSHVGVAGEIIAPVHSHTTDAIAIVEPSHTHTTRAVPIVDPGHSHSLPIGPATGTFGSGIVPLPAGSSRIADLEKENAELRAKLASFEAARSKETVVPSRSPLPSNYTDKFDRYSLARLMPE